jgi:uncharacterized protein YndB with AHSA1/START domain
MAGNFSAKSETVPVTQFELEIRRVFNAPLDLVWKAWTESDRLAQWWGPKGYSMTVSTIDLRAGGLFHYAMLSPNGKNMWGRFIYSEVEPQNKLVFINSFSDEAGGITRNPMSEVWPLEVKNTLIFSEKEGQTTLIMRGFPYNATPEEHRTFSSNRENLQKGMAGTFEQLDAYLADNQ